MTTYKKIKITAVVISIVLFALVTPFYLGYGNPLPQTDYSTFENIWLTAIPIMLTGLLIGIKWERVAAWMIIIPVSIGFVYSLLAWEDPCLPMVLPLIPGLLYWKSSKLRRA
jgi:Na+/proline symporter